MRISKRWKPRRTGKIQPLAEILAKPVSGGYSTASRFQGGQIAQLVEQGIENPRVGGSIPSLATISPLS